MSQEGGATDKTPIPTAAVRAAVNLTISRLGFQPDLLLVHNRESSLRLYSIVRLC